MKKQANKLAVAKLEAAVLLPTPALLSGVRVYNCGNDLLRRYGISTESKPLSL